MTMTRVWQGAFGRVVLADINRPMAPHVHHHCHLLFKVGGHDNVCMIEGRLFPTTDDSVVLVNAWEKHHIGANVRRRPVTILALYVEPGWIGRRLGTPVAGAWTHFQTGSERLSPPAKRMRDHLTDSMIAGADPNEAMLEALASEVVGSAMLRSRRDTGRDRADDVDERVLYALQLMARAPGEIVDMGAFARELGMSRARFFARFRSAVGASPALCANHFRVEAATRGLADLATSIAELSLDLGFSDQPNFTRFFSKHLGVPPAAYRRALQGDRRASRV